MSELHDTRAGRHGVGGGPGVGAPGRDPHRGDAVSLRAQRVALVASLTARVRAVGERLWALPPAAIGLVAVDAALALPGWARVVLGVLLVAMAGRAVLALVWPGRGARVSVLGAARLVEDRLGLRDNALVNALQLRPTLVSGDGVTAALAERVVDHGVEVVRASEGERIVDGRGAARAWAFVAGAAVVVVVSMAVMPRVWAAGVPRYVDPFGDHPAWSPTAFRVDVTPREVLVGDDATVTVRLGGKIPESVELVFVDGAGRELDRAGMGAVPTGALGSDGAQQRPREYRLTLHDLREPIRLYPVGSTGRGGVVEIAVLDKPRVQSATLVIRPPAYAGVPATSERVDLGEDAVRRRVLVGSEVELRVESSVEIGDVDRSGGTVTGDIDVAGRTVMQRVAVERAGEEVLSLRPVSRSGLRADDTVRVGLDAVADAPPRVIVHAPAGAGERAAVLESTGAPVRAVGEDDVGVASLDVEWRVRRMGESDGGSAERTPLRVARPMRTRWDGELVLDTGAIGAHAGDEIELWVESSDGRGEAFGGAQTTRVGPILVSVIDEKEYRRRSLERMGIDDIVEPYEEIARGAEELARAAREAAEAAQRAATGEGSAEEAVRAARRAQGKRDALKGEIERRLASEPLVDFDEDMRAALEGLRDRIAGMEPAGGEGETPDEAADRAERNAERADLASREAALEVKKPSERLRMAAQMRAELDRLDRIATRQRALSDRLAAMGDLPASDAVKIAEEQRRLMEQTDGVCARLDRLGDGAANELPGADALGGAELGLARARREAQEAIEDARDGANASTGNLVDALSRADMREAADLALTELYFASDPALDSVREVGDVVSENGARLDDPDVGAAASEGRERIRKALEAIEQIEQYLEQVRERMRREDAGSTAQHVPTWSPLTVVAMLAIGAVEADEAGADGVGGPPAGTSVRERFVRALETARVRLGALKARLREAEEAMSAPLPVMGGSAMELADRVNTTEIAEAMYDAEWAMSEGDLTGAQERAALAADRLEALYESVVGGPSQCRGSDDSPLQLLKGDPSASSESDAGQGSGDGSSGTSVGSAGAGGGSAPSDGLPNALDVLSRSGGGAAGGGESNDGDQQGASDDPGDRGGFTRAGATPGGGAGRGESGARGRGGEGEESRADRGSGEGDDASGSGDPRVADRARRFNEKLYAEPVQMEKAVEGEGEAVRTEAEVIHLEGGPAGREDALRSTLVRAGLSGAEVAAVFERVPPAYRDVVAAYLMRIARDEASGETSDSARSR